METQQRHVAVPKKAQSIFAVMLVTGCSLIAAFLMSEQIAPNNGQDEAYYTMAARVMGNLHCTPKDDLLCNLEHPPLAKMIIRASFWLTNTTRTFNILLSASIAPLTYAIALKLLRSEKAALIAGLLIALDGYFFYTTAVGNLEAPMIAFSMGALLVYVYGLPRILLRPSLNIPSPSIGTISLIVIIMLLSLALYSKYSAAFSVFALAIWHGYKTRKYLQAILIAILPFILSVIYLEPYDLWATGFANSIDHIRWMMGFHVVASTVPGQFWLGDLKSWTPVNYFFMFGEIEGGDHKVGGLAAIAGLTMPMAYLYLRHKGKASQFSEVGGIVLVFFASYMLEMLALHLDGRILYIYYIPEIMPIIAISAAWLALFVRRSLVL